jgi:predicted transposase/invertase (TIGR01784 family)
MQKQNCFHKVNPLDDYLFIKYMGVKGAEAQLLSFLNAVLYHDGKNLITELEIIENPEIMAEVSGGKKSAHPFETLCPDDFVIDAWAKFADGTAANIEVQLINSGSVEKRLLHWMLKFAEIPIDTIQDCSDIPKTIAFNIVNIDYSPLTTYYACLHFASATHPEETLTDMIEIHCISMIHYRQLKEKNLQENSLHRWLTFFDKNAALELREKAVSMDSAIQKAKEAMLLAAIQDEE